MINGQLNRRQRIEESEPIMTDTLIVSTSDLFLHLSDPAWLVVDCRFYLQEPGRGRQEYLGSHIPGAVYAHLDEDLSDPVLPGRTGRHPLPNPEKAARAFGRLGIGPGLQVVAYDANGGALAAARLWWMLRWLDFTTVAVLDGGWQHWVEAGFPVMSGAERRAPRFFMPQPHPEMLASVAEVEFMRRDKHQRVLDARTYDRYLGQNEIIDPVAGHIPGAVSVPYTSTLNPDFTLRAPDELRALYENALGEVPAAQAAVYCGSGVTAAQGILAMMLAGLGEARLYTGSWSEWITDPSRPVATGDR